MTVWAIEVVTSPESDPTDPKEAREASVITEVGGEALANQAVRAELVSEPVPHYRALHRVEGGYPLDAVLDAVEARLGDRAWYRVASHTCSHDGSGPCGPWVTQRTFGIVPEGV